METITMWAEMSSKATNAQSKTDPDTHVRNAILGTDITKIKNDAETLIKNSVKNSKRMNIYRKTMTAWFTVGLTARLFT